MARKKKPAPRKKKKGPKRFQFQLSLAGVAGVAVVMFCLFLWMFLLGIWAGQTILLPTAGTGKNHARSPAGRDSTPVKILKPRGVKTPAPHKSGMVERGVSRRIGVILLKSRQNQLSA